MARLKTVLGHRSKYVVYPQHSQLTQEVHGIEKTVSSRFKITCYSDIIHILNLTVKTRRFRESKLATAELAHNTIQNEIVAHFAPRSVQLSTNLYIFLLIYLLRNRKLLSNVNYYIHCCNDHPKGLVIAIRLAFSIG